MRKCKKANFTIVALPDTLWLYCPHCGESVGVKYGDVKPTYPGGWWQEVQCPWCLGGIELERGEVESLDVPLEPINT